jgi:uncharacterized protein YdeI (YjbR/CyaY-like superfamily)
VTETIKWGSPVYEHQGILLTTPAFKRHCALIFWQGKLIFGQDATREKFRRITSIDDLPGDKVLNGYIKQALQLNTDGLPTPARKKPKARPKPVMPDYFLAALKKNPAARTRFEQFSPSHQREYIEWLAEAKREETRAKRLKTALEWLATGKSRHWKHRSA